MLFSRPCQHAIRALVHIAQHQDESRCQAQEIAISERLPRPALAAVLQKLVRAGLVTSQKGPTGGFSLAREAAEITLYQIMEAVDDVRELSQCAVGFEACSDAVPCPVHDRLQPMRQHFIASCQSVTLAEMAAGMTRKAKETS